MHELKQIEKIYELRDNFVIQVNAYCKTKPHAFRIKYHHFKSCT